MRIVRGKKPEYSLLCAEVDDKLSDGQRLRVMRLRAGLTIREAAEMVKICRHTLMNYEGGRTKVKAPIEKRLVRLYQSLIDKKADFLNAWYLKARASSNRLYLFGELPSLYETVTYGYTRSEL